MVTEECAICGDSVPFSTTTHVLVNPKHEDNVADHYVCRPCYDEHLEGLFAALAGEENEAEPEVNVANGKNGDDDPVSDGVDDSDEEPIDPNPSG